MKASEFARTNFLGFPLAAVSADDLILALVAASDGARGKPLLACYLNAHTSNLAAKDARLAECLREADVVYADGMAVVWGARFLGAPIRERTSAADFFVRFAWACAARGRRVALVGGKPGIAAKCAERLRGEVTGIEIVLAHDGHFQESEDEAVISEIRASRADIVLLGMGTPRQELFAKRLSHLNTALSAAPEGATFNAVWCVGALFDYCAGVVPRAPQWMRSSGLEWLHRLACEPGRMAARYLLGNPAFALRVLRARFQNEGK